MSKKIIDMAKKNKKIYDLKYIDRYDRSTIELLKKIENKYPNEPNEPNNYGEFEEHLRFLIEFGEAGAFFARNKERVMDEWIQEDERQAKLISQNPIPSNIKCNVCDSKMEFDSHSFDMADVPILFLFNCIHESHKRKIVLPTGNEYIRPKRVCPVCNAFLDVKKEVNGCMWAFITSCMNCSFREVDEFLAPNQNELISDADRQKYCTKFIGYTTVMEQLSNMGRIGKELFEEQQRKKLAEEMRLDRIERLNVPTVETRIKQAIEGSGYSNIHFEKPELSQVVTVPFYLQDPTNRDKTDSLRMLAHLLKDCLLFTNWRLVESKLSYRLGVVTGCIRGFETENDLMNLAKEIAKQSPN